MDRIATEPDLGADLNEKARMPATEFSWQKSADRLWKSMEKAINS